MRAEHFFTADTHFTDPCVLGVSERPFGTVEEMDETIVERWNATVRPHDVVWVLGDVTTDIGPSPVIARLNGVKYLVAGNHDWCFAGFENPPVPLDHAVRMYRDAGFKAVVDGRGMTAHNGRPIRVLLRGGPSVDLSHFPYDPDPWRPAGAPDPWLRWRPRRPARGPAPWLVHGHVHVADQHVTGRQVNVAMDMWDFRPVPAEVIAELIETD